jgi:hypothetical protein
MGRTHWGLWRHYLATLQQDRVEFDKPLGDGSLNKRL